MTLLPPGVIPPIVTPLLPSGRLDLESLDALLEFQLRAGVAGVLPLGSTGEAFALHPRDRAAVLRRVVETVGGRVLVLAGLPAIGTLAMAEEARAHVAAGADAVLAPAPAGTRLAPSELREHFRLVAEAAGAPVVAYEVPSRVHVTLDVALVLELARDGLVAGIKDSSCDLMRGRTMLESTRELPGFRCYVGGEEAMDVALLMGFDGAVPGLANIAPELHVELARHAADGDWPAARAVQSRIVSLARVFGVTRPGGSFDAQALGAMKLGLVGRGVIAHATLHPPLLGDEAAQREGVDRIVAEVLAGAPTA
jgi:4-hydroxy-tetrahydrodipicolinate synthase